MNDIMDRLRETVARIISPEPFAKFDASHAVSKGVTYEKLNAVGGMQAARKKADEILAALAAHEAGQTAGVAEGWVLVPIKATEEMHTAGRLARMNIEGGYDGPSSWEAMLSTAPSPEQGR